MAIEIELVRPPVISKETRNILDEYRGFRHIVRNVYSLTLSATRIEPLVMNLRDSFNNVEREMEDFLNFLDVQTR